MKKITTGLVLVVLACLSAAFGAGFAIYLRPAQATRNSSGTMSIPNTFTAGTTISSSSVNANFADIGTELTASLERNGKGGMLAALRGIDGTLAAPAFSWTSETGSGLFRNGASDVRMSISGGLRQQWSSTGTSVTGTLGVTGVATLSTSLAVGGASPGTWTSNGSDIFLNTGTAASSITLRPNGAGSGTGEVSTSASGLKIGSSGTAVSQSGRGTASLTPAAINAQQCQTQTVTVSGATAGTECLAGMPSGGLGSLSLTCNVTSATACTLYICNPTAGSVTPPAGTYTCRYFSP